MVNRRAVSAPKRSTSCCGSTPLPLDFDILPTIGVQPLELLRIIVPIGASRVFAGARLARPRHLPHQALALGVLAEWRIQYLGGTVEAAGEGVTHVQPGDFVIVNWRAVCGQCRACKRGRPWYCFDSRNAVHRGMRT